MKISFSVLSLLCLTALTGCESSFPVIHEGDNQGVYKILFDEDVPPDIEVINSFHAMPAYQGLVNVTPTWAIELTATKQWIEKKVKLFRMQKTEDTALIKSRLKDRGRYWNAPKDISQYEIYIDDCDERCFTMLVDKTLLADNRYRVFVSAITRPSL
jgi:hypothetical protein